MVTASEDTRLIGYTEVIGEIVVPKAFLGDMASLRIGVILDIGIGKILPRMMILSLMLIRERRIKAPFIQGSDTQVQMIDIAASLGKEAMQRQQADCQR